MPVKAQCFAAAADSEALVIKCASKLVYLTVNESYPIHAYVDYRCLERYSILARIKEKRPVFVDQCLLLEKPIVNMPSNCHIAVLSVNS